METDVRHCSSLPHLISARERGFPNILSRAYTWCRKHSIYHTYYTFSVDDPFNREKPKSIYDKISLCHHTVSDKDLEPYIEKSIFSGFFER